jgi:signal transduction histidine kinase
MRSTTSPEEILNSLVHDLRQPLGNIETSIFYLDLLLDHPSDRAGGQLRTMERQVAQAVQLLHRAAGELRALRDQRAVAEGAGSLPLTNSATAGVA